MPRNKNVEATVASILRSIDDFSAGSRLDVPLPQNRYVCDAPLTRSASVRLASLFLANYSLQAPSWDFESIPTGIVGRFGDQTLADELTRRCITLHDAITAFGENLGWKGNVANARLSADPRFKEFAKHLKQAAPAEREHMARYLAYRF